MNTTLRIRPNRHPRVNTPRRMSRLNQQQVPVEDGNDKDANLQGAGAGVAPRNNRDAWLRRSTPRRGVIVLLTIATAALLASVVVLVPFLKRHVHRSPVPMQHANLPKPQFNETHHDSTLHTSYVYIVYERPSLSFPSPPQTLDWTPSSTATDTLRDSKRKTQDSAS